MTSAEIQTLFNQAEARFAKEDRMARKKLDARIGWYDERDSWGKWKAPSAEELMDRGIRQPWWLPGDLRLTDRGLKVYEATIALFAMLVLIGALLIVGSVEQ